MHMDVFIPQPDCPLEIVPGAGVVGTRRDDGTVLVDHSDEFDRDQLPIFADRIAEAARRHHKEGGSSTRVLLDEQHLVEIGGFDAKYGVVTLVVNEPFAWPHIARWCGIPEDPEAIY